MRALRMVAVCMLASATVSGCDDKPKAALQRSDMARASDTVKTVEVPKAVEHAPVATTTPRALCTLLPAAAGKPLPSSPLERVVAPGAPDLPEKLLSSSRWTWVNLWAGWCGPCKQEIPLLRKWARELASTPSAFDMVFVSLDDDARQARKFVEEQPLAGLRASYLAHEGPSRDAFVRSLGLKPDPSLPVHALFNPAGKLACVVEGAIEESDKAFFVERFRSR